MEVRKIRMTASSTWFIISAGVFAILGFIVNFLVDRDNLFDMTTSGLFLVTIVLAFIGLFLAKRERAKLEERPVDRQQGPVARTAP
jgi:amino acid transporter